MKLSILEEAQQEINRFQKRLDEAKESHKSQTRHQERIESSKQRGALKRAALDLKNVLTKVNQATYYG